MIDFEEIEDMGYEDNTEESDTGFSIVSDLQAEWTLKKIKKAAEERDRLVELANKEIEELTKQIEVFEQRYKSDTGFLQSKLFEYFTKVEHKETKTQETYKLLSGSLVLKKPATKIKRPDDDRLLGILKEIDPLEQYVETIQKPKWAEFKKTLKLLDNGQIVDEDGDIVEGLEVEDVPGEFTVKI